MLFMYVLGLQINYSPVNWERCYVIERSLWACSSSEFSFTEETHLQSIWFNSSWQEQGEVAGGGGWLTLHAKVEGGGKDRHKDKARLSEWESSWKMVDSFLVQEKSGHWSGGDAVPSHWPSWIWHPLSRKGHPPFSQLTDCHSQISSSVPSESVGLPPSLLSKTLAKNCFLSPFIWATKILYTYCREISGLVYKGELITWKIFFSSTEVLRRHMHEQLHMV